MIVAAENEHDDIRIHNNRGIGRVRAFLKWRAYEINFLWLNEISR